MFAVIGNYDDIKDFVDALEDAGVQGAVYVSIGDVFNGTRPVRVSGEDFGYYDPETKTITLLNNSGSGSNADA